jgi:hypothetical protein
MPFQPGEKIIVVQLDSGLDELDVFCRYRHESKVPFQAKKETPFLRRPSIETVYIYFPLKSTAPGNR